MLFDAQQLEQYKFKSFSQIICRKMLQLSSFIRFKKCFVVFVVFLFTFSSLVYAQSNSTPYSVCQLLKNKKKLKGKKIIIEGILEIAPETSTFQVEDECSVYEAMAVGEDDSFKSNAAFEKATNLLSLQSKAEEKIGVSLHWSVLLRVKIKVEGILHTSNKPKFGHLNSYKNLFLITNAEKVGQTQLLTIGDSKIIMTQDNQ